MSLSDIIKIEDQEIDEATGTDLVDMVASADRHISELQEIVATHYQKQNTPTFISGVLEDIGTIRTQKDKFLERIKKNFLSSEDKTLRITGG